MVLALHTVPKSASPTLIVDSNGQPWRGMGVHAWSYWEDNFDGMFNGYSVAKANNYFNFLKSQGMNFVRCHVDAESLLYHPAYGSRLQEVSSIADTHGIYIIFDILSLTVGGYPNVSTLPYTPYVRSSERVNTTALFNQSMAELARLLVGRNNGFPGTFNEPMTINSSKSQGEYDCLFNNLPGTLQAIRNAGYTGLIFINGANVGSLDNTSMDWAVKHLDLFTDYGSVVADWHAYYYWSQVGDYNTLKNILLNNYKMAQAQNLGVPMIMGENGVHSPPSNSGEAPALDTYLRICNENGIGWTPLAMYSGGEWPLLASENPYSWNAIGQILKNRVIAQPPPVTKYNLTVTSVPTGIPFTVTKVA